VERNPATVIAMDIAGDRSQMARDDTGVINRLKSVRTGIIDPAISRYEGLTRKLTDESTVSEFPDTLGAVQCALEIQRELRSRNTLLGEKYELLFRIGLHFSEIRGDGVAVASQLQGLAEPGGVVLTKQVYDLVVGKISAKFVSFKELTIKNVRQPFETYRVDFSVAGDVAKGVRFRDYELDFARFEIKKSGERIAIEPQAFDLIVFLARNNDRTVTKEEILSEIWDDRIVSDAALSSQIKAARKALGDDGSSQHTIRTIHGRGFRFVAAIEKTRDGPVPVKIQDIAELASSNHGKMPSIAVLPLENLVGENLEDYLADGITEDITTALAKNRWLAVVARNSAFAFRNSSKGMETIGYELGADYIVSGSVRKAGSRVRVSLELVDTESGKSVWSERFDRDMVDIFDLQDEIAEMVTARVEPELGLTEQRKAERRPRKNRGAWDLYQLGVSEFYKFTPEANEKCQERLRQCIDLDPELGCAHSRLAYAIVLSMVYFDAPPEAEKLNEALISATRAIELDGQDANSYFTIGRVHLARREYDLAIDALEQAVKLNPYQAITYCGLGDSLAYEGRLDEAIQQFEIAMRLSPHDPFRWAFYSYRSLAHLFRHEFEDAVLWARKSVQVPNAQYWPNAHLVAALGHLGDADQGVRALDDLKRVKPEFSLAFARKHLFYLKREDQLEIYITGLEKAGLN
jgi:TolB-like protein/DNA-binding response OmpR family regulator